MHSLLDSYEAVGGLLGLLGERARKFLRFYCVFTFPLAQVARAAAKSAGSDSESAGMLSVDAADSVLRLVEDVYSALRAAKVAHFAAAGWKGMGEVCVCGFGSGVTGTVGLGVPVDVWICIHGCVVVMTAEDIWLQIRVPSGVEHGARGSFGTPARL